jgi:hypothetical protein
MGEDQAAIPTVAGLLSAPPSASSEDDDSDSNATYNDSSIQIRLYTDREVGMIVKGKGSYKLGK